MLMYLLSQGQGHFWVQMLVSFTAQVLLRSDESEAQRVFRPTINRELDYFLISTNRFN